MDLLELVAIKEGQFCLSGKSLCFGDKDIGTKYLGDLTDRQIVRCTVKIAIS